MLIEGTAVGLLLRHWRQRLSLSQLDLALTAEISTRHLSFIETGRARPSRAVIDRLAEALKLDVENADALRLGAGFAPLRLPPSAQTPVKEMPPIAWAGFKAESLSVEEQAAADMVRQASAWDAADIVYVGTVTAIETGVTVLESGPAILPTPFAVRIAAEHALKGQLAEECRTFSFQVAQGAFWSAFHGSQLGDRVIVYSDRQGPSDRSDRVMLNRLRHPPTLHALATASR